MNQAVPISAVPHGLAAALETKGFSELTTVQQAVIDPALAGRDLRMSSQTGSGKTVAIGIVLAEHVVDAPRARGEAAPSVLVIAPTRELAAQIGTELGWLYRGLGTYITVLTGGTNMGRDFAALARGPQVLIATPGRLLDHPRRGSIRLDAVRAVVLDEADQMLDMGFREELEGILDQTPSDRRTHLVSATLPREVLALANRYQRNPASVHGTEPGAANDDIDHVGHLVRSQDKVGALINLLLAAPDQRMLVFVRTRLATSELALELSSSGFSAASLSGDMGQRERTATLEAFRSNAVRVLVATDVAARGLDIADVSHVVHFDPPENSEAFTHRSGRTGRAGNKGTSVLFVPPAGRRWVEQLLRRADVQLSWQAIPTPEQIRTAADDRLVGRLAGGVDVVDPRMQVVAKRLLENADAVDVVAALLQQSDHVGPCQPRTVQPITPDRHTSRPAHGAHGGSRPARGQQSFTAFHISWGGDHGANPSRLLALVCRRGGVPGSTIGAIRISKDYSMVEVANGVAEKFERAASRVDHRNPRVKIRPWQQASKGSRHQG